MMRKLILLAAICRIGSMGESRRFIYKALSQVNLAEARSSGQQAYGKYLVAVSNVTEDNERNAIYEEYFVQCNRIGKERERLVEKAVGLVKSSSNYKLLLTMGLQPFVARFLTLPSDEINKGIVQLCTKFEMQLQCQLGFGQSRSEILSRVEQMKSENGNLKVLLEQMCSGVRFDPHPYSCIGHEPQNWTEPCYNQMLAYNYTRYSAGRRIAHLHLKATDHVDRLLDLADSTKTHEENVTKQVQEIMKSALLEISEIEAEKCFALGSVMTCVLPIVSQKCGSTAEEVLRTITLVGYLPRERREQLQSHFDGFQVESHPRCLSLDPSI